MDLSALIVQQIEADRRRGFAVDFDDVPGRLEQMERDLIGLFGEIGEFANLLKKVRLVVSHPGYSGPRFDEAAPHLKEELADALIYLMRISVLLGGDLEGELIRKMRINESRYGSFET
jgi:NTP pyrophosphatase (non-canonical NTP hydrolase)